jgi:hypothetical protein
MLVISELTDHDLLLLLDAVEAELTERGLLEDETVVDSLLDRRTELSRTPEPQGLSGKEN